MSQFEIHPATIDEPTLLAQCEVRRLRRSGPGGQHRNKVETAIHLRHRGSQIEAEANERRSQAENQKVALRRLRINLALEIRSSSLATTPPSTLWRNRCQQRRVSVNPNHNDFPALLAEALDYVTASEWDIKLAAERLDCSTSQLIKFLKLEPRAIAQVNQQRVAAGKHRLK